MPTLPTPSQPPGLEARPTKTDTSWPEGAPSPQVAIDQLFRPGIYAKLRLSLMQITEDLAAAEASVRKGETPAVIPSHVHVPEVYPAATCQPEWERAQTCGTRATLPTVSLWRHILGGRPASSRPVSRISGARLAWPDEDMLYRAKWDGGTSHSSCAKDTVFACIISG
ncbi:MAG: hypothetical protein SGPRY_005881 [Prymnesium sp.]